METSVDSGLSNRSQNVSWKELTYQFTQDTTLHGIKNITAPTSYVLRRVLWAILVLGAITFFCWFLSDRLIYLNDHPKTVDVEVIYTDSVQFPAVTICNQNLFRTSATAELGLYDVVEESFRKILGSYEDDGFDAHTNKYLEGAGEPHATYVNITSQVCKQLCEDIHSDSCCSVTYDRATRTCLISPLEHGAEGVYLKYKLYTDYYKRKKCQDQRTMDCTFEDKAVCNFVTDFTKTVEWKWTGDSPHLDSALPSRDHTLVSENGSMMYAATKFPSPNDIAHLISPYILSSDSTCIKFFYWINSGILNIKIIARKEPEVLLWNKAADGLEEWQKAYFKLPKGYYRLIFEAVSGEAADGLKMAVDDINIGQCQEQSCLETSSGYGYTGRQNSPKRGKKQPTCLYWNKIAPFLYRNVWKYQNTSLTGAEINDQSNYCRNPDSDQNGPWCFTGASTDITQMQYCHIPQCGCRDVEFRCANGKCISRDLLCDLHDHCGDYSDELEPCNRTSSVECGFDDQWMCGYSSPRDYRAIPWRAHGTYPKGYLTLETDSKGVRNGYISQIHSPTFSIDADSCLHIDYNIFGHLTLDILLVSTDDTSHPARLCSLPPGNQTVTGWNSTDMLLSPGEYYLVLEVVVHTRLGSVIRLDNVTLLNENCTFDAVPITTEIPLSTWDYENSTWENQTFTDQTTDGSTYSYYTTAEPYVDPGPHPPFLHLAPDQCGTRSTAPASFEKRLSDKECIPTFQRVVDSSFGVRSSCPRVTDEGGYGYTLERCKRETTDFGGNVFNFRNSECYMHRCEDTGDTRLVTDVTGGWYVYALAFSEEPNGIECTFQAECACGYNFTTSNVNYRWQRQARIIDTNGTVNETDYFATVGVAGDQQPTEGRHWLRLISPWSRDNQGDQCLSFYYLLRYVNITVYRVTSKGRAAVLRIERDGQRGVWHTATVSLRRGSYRVQFEVEFLVKPDELPITDFGIDKITLEKGLCTSIDRMGPVDCSFGDDDYCGYRDHSEGLYKWIRSRNHSPEGFVPGVFYMRTSGHTKVKETAVLKSPFYTYKDFTCISFYFFLQGADSTGLSTLSLSRELSNGTEVVEWLVRTVTDNDWHFGQTQFFSSQPFRLVFRLTGKDIRGGVDHITVNNDTCPGFNCTDEEFMCGRHLACIPKMNLCDKVANCDLAEDEFNCQGNVTSGFVDEEAEEAGSGLATTPPVKANPSSLGSAMTLTDIYMRAGHQGEDFLYRCKFEGKPCNMSQIFTKQVTDYGVCYTFNSEPETPLMTAKTGSRFGLSLTLNIEQYEYMLGPQSDAGIKVFLHSGRELPEVRDLGFAIPPGAHALVGVRLNEAENLPPPWGECSTKPLEYSSYYTYSLCQRECETADVVRNCSCRDAYMPGKTHDTPPICNLSMYFTCAIPTINSVAAKTGSCSCPKPCNQTIYEPSLSQAALSFLSVDNILSDNKELELIRSSFHNALEKRQRVLKEEFAKDIKLITTIAQIFKDMRRTGKTYLGDFKKSFFAKVWSASTTLVKEVFQSDVNDLLKNMKSYQAYYNKNFKTYVENVQSETLINNLKTLYQDLDSLIRGYPPSAYFDRTILDTMIEVNLGRNRLNALSNRLTNKSYISESPSVDDSQAEPKRFNTNEAKCRNTRQKVTERLFLIESTLKGISETVSDREGQTVYNVTLLKLARTFITEHNANFKTLLLCLNEYPAVLSRVINWHDDVIKETTEAFVDGAPFGDIDYAYDEEVTSLLTDERELVSLLSQYSQGRITKLQYLHKFSIDAQNSHGVLGSLVDFVRKIEKKILRPLQERLDDMYDTLNKYYVEALEKAMEFEEYLEPKTFYNTAKLMSIWKIPKPDLENPDVFKDAGQNYWSVWNSDVSIAAFARHGGPVAIREGLDAYCGELTKKVKQVEDQFVENQNKLNDKLEEINDQYKEYKHSREINHKFVLDNFLNVDVYFAQLKHQKVRQLKAYEITQFFGDVGGFMGLLLGASALTVFELIDLVVFNCLKKLQSRKKSDEKEQQKLENAKIPKANTRDKLYRPGSSDENVNVISNPLNGVTDYGFSNTYGGLT